MIINFNIWFTLKYVYSYCYDPNKKENDLGEQKEVTI